jgi:hypothetical protein
MKGAAFLALILGTSCFAGQAQKPACNAKNQGQFWPPEANLAGDARLQHFQEGNLEMCSLVVWKYKWQRVSVNVRDLRSAKQPAPSNAATQPPTAK